MASICLSFPASQISDGLFSLLVEDEILHQILYALTLKQKAITSAVSRKWRHMIASFHDRKLIQRSSTDKFCVWCDPAYCGDCFRLHSVIKLAADNSFTEFYLFVRCFSSYKFEGDYFGDQTAPAFLESRLLTVLHIKGCCKFEGDYFGDIKELSSLKEIYFDSVAIYPTTFSNLINKFPSIVELTLKKCYFLYSISVPDLKQLNVLRNFGTTKAIEIKARNLLEFHFFILSSSALKLDLKACTKLQVLKLDCKYIPIGFPKEVSSVFPSLKSLFLRLCKKLKNIKLLSPELENLTLSDMANLHDAIIVTPNLHSLKLIDTKRVPSSSPVVGSSLMEAEVGLKLVYATDRLPYLRKLSENLGENLIFSLAITAIESTVLLDELKGREREFSKCYKLGNYKCWRYFLKAFKILESTTRQGAHLISLEFQWSG